MRTSRLYTFLFVRLLFLIAAVAAGFYAFSAKLSYTGVFIVLTVILLVIELFTFIRQRILFYDKTIEAILHDDFTADLTAHASFGNYKSLIRLYDSMKARQNEQATQDLVYRSILNNLETAVVILREGEEDWDIVFSNDYFSSYFDIPHVTKWKYLKRHLPSICKIIEEANFQDIRTSAQISTGNDVKQAFMFQASRSCVFGRGYYILLLDSIQSVVAKKEKDAWINLMKVISHELMNSITPIRSLSQHLNELIRQEQLSAEDIEEVRQSVGAIMRRSDHLQNFIESYRTLAMLPSPQKAPLSIKEIVDSVLQLMSPVFEEEGIDANNTIEDGYTIMADALQLEQVFINLFTNSIYAMAGNDFKKIEIGASETTERVFITVTDTGQGIDKEIEEKIFLPFFTTRKQGAGIGLTLSKNIIEGHGGYLNFQVEDGRTCFTICLLQ